MIYTDGAPTIVSQNVIAPGHYRVCMCEYHDDVKVCKCREEDDNEYGIYDSEA